jgi:TRAP-type mannitol/chloroaromatic compound transport system permease small subunit
MSMIRAALSRLCLLIDRLCSAGAAVAATCCALLALMLISESIATAAFEWSQPWAVEYSAYLCALTLLAGSGYTLTRGAHIRVPIALEYLPRSVSRWLDLVCTLFAIAIVSILVAGLFDLSLRSYQRGSVSYFVMQTPLWIPQSLLAMSAILLWLALFARSVRLLIGESPERVIGAAAPVHEGHA